VRSPTEIRILTGRQVGIVYQEWEDGQPVRAWEEVEGAEGGEGGEEASIVYDQDE
jgi:hypothetical protein